MKQVDNSLASEVIAALKDLAQYASSAISGTSSRVADRLLERLLLLCAAQRGLLVLTINGQQSSLPSASVDPVLRILAKHAMGEEETRSLLAALPEGDGAVQPVPSWPCWLMCRLPLSAPLIHQQGKFTGDHPTAEQPLRAYLMLGWPALECEAAVEKGQHLLLLVAEAAGTVIVNLLLAERLQELEAATASRVANERELLKAELLALVSHELRSPLASIKGYTDTLLRHERRISHEERHDFLFSIQEASNRLELIIDRLLELSQLETGAIQLSCSAVDVVRLVQEAITVASLRASGEVSDRLTFDLHPKDAAGRLTDEEPLVKADPRRLREVLDHLLENAMTYTPESGAIDVIIRPVPHGLVPGIRCESAREDTPGSMSRHMLEICVCDHGLGIPPEHLDRIFERFHRVDTRLTRETGGLGLGLTICKYLVELHNGIIWAESCPAGGSAFHVWLPVVEEEISLAALAETRIP